MTAKTLRYEDAAERVTAEGWACKTCRRWYGEEEHIARWCCCADRPCGTDGCDGRAHRSYTKCRACINDAETARWNALKRVPYAGEPVCLWGDDRYFFDEGSLIDYCEDEGVEPSDLRLEACERQQPRHFDLPDFINEEYADDADLNAPPDAEVRINAIIAECWPEVWIGVGKAIDPETLPGAAPDPESPAPKGGEGDGGC